MVGRSPFRRHHSPEAVVPLHSVPPTRTGAGVVPEAGGSPVAQWAEAIGACNREPEPHAEQEGGLQVQPQCLGRAGGQPRTSPGLLQKPQVGPLCFAGSGDGQLGQLGSVQRGREVLLSGRADRRSSDAVGSQHGSVEPLHRSGGSGPVSRIAGIQLLAPGSRNPNKGQVGGRAVEGGLPESKTTISDAEGGLLPGPVRERQ